MEGVGWLKTSEASNLKADTLVISEMYIFEVTNAFLGNWF